MVSAEIAITLREEFGLTAVSRAHPDAAFHYLAGIAEPDRGLGLVEVRADRLDAILADVRANPAVRNYELLDRHAGRAVFQYETDVAMLYEAVRDAGIVPAFPYVIRDGTLFFETTTTPDRLSRLGTALRELDVPIDVTTISESFGTEDVLTDRQRQVVLAAIERGYYDTPRACSLSDLADELGVATSTASKLLHRAEGRVMKRYADSAGDAGRSGVGSRV